MCRMASRPSAGRLPWAARPRVVTSTHSKPLWVGGHPQIRRLRDHRPRRRCGPRPALPRRRSRVPRPRPPPPPAGPRSRPPRTRNLRSPRRPWPRRRSSCPGCRARGGGRPASTGSKGAVIPSTPTVSMWPQSISVRPGASRLATTPTTFGRPGATSVTSTSMPAAVSADAIRSATPASPAPPGTSEGLTESIATRSRSNRTAVSKRSAPLERGANGPLPRIARAGDSRPASPRADRRPLRGHRHDRPRAHRPCRSGSPAERVPGAAGQSGF